MRLLAQLESADWMARWGVGGSDDVVYLNEWAEVLRGIEQSKDAMQDLQGEYTARLRVVSPKLDSRWNEMVDKYKEVLHPLIDKKLSSMAERFTQEDRRLVRDRVRWILLHALIEESFYEVMGVRRFGALADFLIAGHLPCGWAKDNSPLVY